METEIVIIHDTSGSDPHPGLCRCCYYCAWCNKQILSPVKPMQVLAVVCSLRCKVEYGNYLESKDNVAFD